MKMGLEMIGKPPSILEVMIDAGFREVLRGRKKGTGFP